MAEMFEPRTTFDVRQFNNIVITVKKVKEVFSFQVRCLKGHFPPISNVVAFVLLAKIPRQFAREKQDRVE